MYILCILCCSDLRNIETHWHFCPEQMDEAKTIDCEICFEPLVGQRVWFAGSHMHIPCMKDAIRMFRQGRPSNPKKSSTVKCLRCAKLLTLVHACWVHTAKADKAECKCEIEDEYLESKETRQMAKFAKELDELKLSIPSHRYFLTKKGSELRGNGKMGQFVLIFQEKIITEVDGEKEPGKSITAQQAKESLIENIEIVKKMITGTDSDADSGRDADPDACAETVEMFQDIAKHFDQYVERALFKEYIIRDVGGV